MNKIQSRITKQVEIRQFVYEVDDIRVDFGTTKFTEDGDILSIDGGGIYADNGDRICEFYVYTDADNIAFRRLSINIEYVYAEYVKYIFEAMTAISKKEFEDVEVFDYERRQAIAIEKARLAAEAQARALYEAEHPGEGTPVDPDTPVEEITE